jgi:GGDEF domain-containing protein
VSALVVFLAVFGLLVEYGRPGLGISQGFYLAIVLVALAGGPFTGAAAGVTATALCVAAAVVHGHDPVSALGPLGVRLVSFTVAGGAVGYFARRGREMLAESFHVLDELLHLARRDAATGVFTAEGFTARVTQEARQSWPFAVLVGEISARSDAALRDALRDVAAALEAGSVVARLGSGRIAVLTPAVAPERAHAIARGLEGAVPGTSFGWALHPQDGDEALALVGAASERLPERRSSGVVVALRTTA